MKDRDSESAVFSESGQASMMVVFVVMDRGDILDFVVSATVRYVLIFQQLYNLVFIYSIRRNKDAVVGRRADCFRHRYSVIVFGVNTEE